MSGERRRRLEGAALVILLALAALLRVAGIDHHLRAGAPEFDERNNFIDPVMRMWRAPTADPTVYAGYAGFFNWLIFLPVGLGQACAGERGAYVAARLVVAVFGVASVWLVYRAARAFTTAPVAWAAAFVLAVARVEVRHAHYITPDVLVGTALLGLCVLAQRAPSRARDVFAGVLVGLAVATKYSGLLLAPALIVLFWTERRLRAGLTTAAAAALLAFLLAAPYAVWQATEQGTGLAGGVETYYGSGTATNRFAQGEGTSIGALPDLLRASLGPVACLVALLSITAVRRPEVAVAWTVVLGSFAATVPANLVNPRHLLPAEAAVVFLFAVGLAALRRWRVAATLVAIGALIGPVPETVTLVARYLRPAAVDDAVEWIVREIPGPALVATSLRGLQLPRDRFEVRLIGSLDELAPDVLAQYDVVVAASRRERDRLAEFPRRAELPAEDGDPERPVTIFVPRPGAGASLAPATVAVTPEDAAGGLAWDGNTDSCWDAPAGATLLEASWPGPALVARVDVVSGQRAQDWPQRLRLTGLDGGGRWTRVSAEPLRPTRPQRLREGAVWGQSFVLTPPRALTGLRVERPENLAPWRVCEISVRRPAR